MAQLGLAPPSKPHPGLGLEEEEGSMVNVQEITSVYSVIYLDTGYSLTIYQAQRNEFLRGIPSSCLLSRVFAPHETALDDQVGFQPQLHCIFGIEGSLHHSIVPSVPRARLCSAIKPAQITITFRVPVQVQLTLCAAYLGGSPLYLFDVKICHPISKLKQ